MLTAASRRKGGDSTPILLAPRMVLNRIAVALFAVLLGAGSLYAQQRNPWQDLMAPQPSFPPQQRQQQPPPQQQPGGVQSEPLPPPPGQQRQQQGAPQLQQGVPDIASPPLQRPGQKGQPPAKGNAKGVLPEVVPDRPAEQRIANPTAVFSGLDKITGRIFPFEAAIDETVQFGALQVTPRACYTRPPTEPQQTTGFVVVDEITLDSKVRRIFSGWMFAASPGLNAVEHAIYDVWLVDCKQGAPDVARSKS
jgi:hypothetical protein